MRVLYLLPVLFLPLTAQAQQPYSESMADCAALYQNAAQWMDTDDSADRLMHAAIQWADAAVAQATKEGRATTLERVWEQIDRKTEDWEEKGQTVFFTQEFRDWTQYCRSFAQAQGVRITR